MTDPQPEQSEPSAQSGQSRQSGHPALTYGNYLALEEVLSAQRPRSGEHDEMLFIVIHQVYELWFKQLLHELEGLQHRLEAGQTARALHTLGRVLAILKVAVAQLDVLETMTPREFTTFRDRLDASSGFQSAQFRELEATLGRRDPQVFEHYPLGDPGRERIAAAMSRRSVFDSYLRYLTLEGYDVPATALDRDLTAAWEPDRTVQDLLLAVYSADGGAAQVAERLVDVDEGLQEWRYRHVKMVERTIGAKLGTGGSAGAAYLWRTVGHPVFPDLWEIRSRM